ncbi:MAG: two-component system response regulator [Phycisphaerales bacterium]
MMQGGMDMERPILIVDDEDHILRVLRLKLSNAGYDVHTAVDGEDAFDVAQRIVPALVITDFQMPYMTGLDLVRAMGGTPELRDIPVIMLTARGYALDETELDGTRVAALLSKPFSPKSVLEHVQRLMSPAGHQTEEAA